MSGPRRGPPSPLLQRPAKREGRPETPGARAPSVPPAGRASKPPPSMPPPKRSLYLSTVADDPHEEFAYGPAFPEYAVPEKGVLANVAQVRRADAERPLACDVGELPVRRGESVLVETDRGLDLAVVLSAPRREFLGSRPPAKVVRRASEQDLAQEARLRVREAAAARTAGEMVHSLGLAAKVVRAEVHPGQGRTLVYLASEDRLDLRELARKLTAALHGRVELRHVGLRDAARVAGGVGPCGLQLCCNTFLSDFAPVSIRMAKDQGLALKPERVSGVCGRLMCCLVYEDAFYRQQRAMFPKHGKRVQTPAGEGTVRDTDVLARTVRVSLDAGGLETFAVGEVRGLGPRGRDDD